LGIAVESKKDQIQGGKKGGMHVNKQTLKHLAIILLICAIIGGIDYWHYKSTGHYLLGDKWRDIHSPDYGK